MHKFLCRQTHGEPTYAIAEPTYERSGSDRHERAGTGERRQHRPIAMEGSTPLRVRDHHAVAAAHQRVSDLIEAGRDGCKWRLQQEPSAAAQRQARKLSRVNVEDVRGGDLSTSTQRQFQLCRSQMIVEPSNSRGDRRGFVRMVPTHMGRSYDRARASLDSCPRQRNRVGDGRRAIVDLGQHMAVKVYQPPLHYLPTLRAMRCP